MPNLKVNLLTRREAAQGLGISAITSFLGVQPARSNDKHPAVGAIRWDAWWNGSPFSRALTLPQWHARLPWYAKYSLKETRVYGESQEVARREAQYAIDFGIDYFAFDYYYPVDVRLNKSVDLEGMGLALKAFRALKMHKPKYCIVLSSSVPTYLNEDNLDSLYKEIVEMVQESNYIKTPTGRPIIYYMMFNEKPFLTDAQTEKRFQTFLEELERRLRASGESTSYKIVLNFWPLKLMSLINKYGFDAASSYGNPRGSSPDGFGRALPFVKCAQGSQYYWRIATEQKVPLIPPVSLGWDFRPLLDAPDGSKRSKAGDYCLYPTDDEITSVVKESIELSKSSNSNFPSVLIYAWNEFTEGGWIEPTLDEGTRRLAAILKGIKASRD